MKNFFIFFSLIFVLTCVFIIQTSPAFAESKFIEGLETTRGQAGAGYPDAPNPMSFLAKMLGSALTPMFMGVSGMLSLIYGGYKWMVARGDEQQVELAKTIIYNTIIALLVAFSAYAIVELVIVKLFIQTQ